MANQPKNNNTTPKKPTIVNNEASFGATVGEVIGFAGFLIFVLLAPATSGVSLGLALAISMIPAIIGAVAGGYIGKEKLKREYSAATRQELSPETQLSTLDTPNKSPELGHSSPLPSKEDRKEPDLSDIMKGFDTGGLDAMKPDSSKRDHKPPAPKSNGQSID